MNKILPLAPMEKLLRKGTEDIRVSEPAKEALREYLEEHSEKIAKLAVEFSLHAGRKTIKEDDVKLAVKRLRE